MRQISLKQRLESLDNIADKIAALELADILHTGKIDKLEKDARKQKIMLWVKRAFVATVIISSTYFGYKLGWLSVFTGFM